MIKTVQYTQNEPSIIHIVSLLKIFKDNHETIWEGLLRNNELVSAEKNWSSFSSYSDDESAPIVNNHTIMTSAAQMSP